MIVSYMINAHVASLHSMRIGNERTRVDHKLRDSDHTAVKITSKVNGKTQILTPPVDLKPRKVLKPILD